MNKNQPMTYQTVLQHQVYLHSGLADIYINGSQKSNVVFFFKELFKLDKHCMEMRLSVVNAQMPVSWYLINSSNNQFNVTVSGVTSYYSITPGNYNINTFINTFNQLGSGLTLSNNTKTNILTFTASSGDFILSDGDNSIFSILGLVKGKLYSSTSSVLVALYPYNFSGLPRINIKSSSFNIKNIDAFNKGRTRTLATIPVNANQNGVIQYVNFTNFKTVFKNMELTSIQLEIMDDFKNYIDFQNSDWTMCLQFDVLSEIVDDMENLEDVYKKEGMPKM